MIVKLLIGLAVVVALVRMVAPLGRGIGRSAGGSGGRPDDHRASGTPPPRVPRADDLEKCPDCGIWLPAGQTCGCDAHA